MLCAVREVARFAVPCPHVLAHQKGRYAAFRWPRSPLGERPQWQDRDRRRRFSFVAPLRARRDGQLVNPRQAGTPTSAPAAAAAATVAPAATATSTDHRPTDRGADRIHRADRTTTAADPRPSRSGCRGRARTSPTNLRCRAAGPRSARVHAHRAAQFHRHALYGERGVGHPGQRDRGPIKGTRLAAAADAVYLEIKADGAWTVGGSGARAQ